MLQADDYKQRLGNRAKDIISFGLGLKVKKDKACCPFHKEDTPSFSWYDEGLNWKCFGCGETMDIYRYYMEYENMTFVEAFTKVADMTGGVVELSIKTKEYKKPNIKTNELSQEAIDYMSIRKISLQTLLDWKVVQRKWNGKDCYVFQYWNENNELEFVSYREIKKGGLKGGCEVDTKPILWGMWHIDTTKPVVITEGQPDAMAIWESGYKNVVSIPSGANNLTWIDNCWDWLEKLDEIIIFGDNDEAGTKLIGELINRLGKYRTKVVSHKRKDANEILFYEGKNEILSLINNTIKQTPAGIVDMSQHEYVKLKNRLDDGIPTGFYQIDSVIEDLQPEQITILVGRNGEGKSTVISQMICNCIENKKPTFLYSGELSNNRVLNWLYKQAIGEKTEYLDMVRTKYKTKHDINDSAIKALKKWSEDLFFTYDKAVSNVRKNTNDLFDVMSVAIKRYGCKLFIIDNLMSAMEENADSLNSDQSNFTQKCKDFAENYGVHVILVVHPNKNKVKEQEIEKEDISGSNNIPNKADNIIAIQRCHKPDRDCDAKLRLLKDREEGQFVEVKLFYDKASKRLLEVINGFVKKPQYSWENFIENTPKNKTQLSDDCPF